MKQGARVLYPGLDWLSAVGMALAAGAAASWLPKEWNEPGRMFLGMAVGMGVGHLLGLVLSIPLGMFEMMYLGGWSGMAAGMLGAMNPGSALAPAGILAALAAGTGVWAAHHFLNRFYQHRRQS